MNWALKGKFGLVVLVMLPLTIASLGMMWNTSRMLEGISASVDQQEAQRTWQAVQAAVAAAEEHLAGTAIDNAHWDDAAAHAYGPIDAEWMAATWGYPTTDINYDTMYIVDANGSLITAYHKGEFFRVAAKTYFGDALHRALQSLPLDGKSFAAVSSLVNTPDGLTLMAAAPLLPTTEGLTIPVERAHVLIFARSLTADILAKMGEQYTVDGLDIRPLVKAGVTDSKLFDHWGHPIAGVTWTARHPGDAARQSYSLSALASMLALIGALLPISVVHARSMVELENKERTARQTARADSLSGLPNRLFLLEALSKALTKFDTQEVTLVFIDLDGFKAVNDAYDHETGDKLIRAVAAGLSALVAKDDVIARLGGDEFAILIVGKEATARSVSLAKHILDFIKEPFNIDGRIANIGASIGIAERRSEALEPVELMRRADIAMYDAKNAGRNCWRHFDQSFDLKRLEDMAIANELRGFLLQGVLEVAYQPMVDSRTHNIIGVEALARWPSCSSRKLSPSRLIAIAEEHGLIDDLGLLVFKIACRDVAQWQDVRLAVNLSPLQINSASLVSDIMRIAADKGLALSRLEVEFTETVLIKNPKRARQVIQELQAAGITVALDDFGTGYASVGYLRDYAFDKIKLDCSLTQNVARDVATQHVVQGTILIAKGLCAEIIAEGVETSEQAQLMRLAGCGQLQGYYFGVPAKAAHINEAMFPMTGEGQNRQAEFR